MRIRRSGFLPAEIEKGDRDVKLLVRYARALLAVDDPLIRTSCERVNI